MLQMAGCVSKCCEILSSQEIQDPPAWLPRNADKQVSFADSPELRERVCGLRQVFQNLASDYEIERHVGERQGVSRRLAECPPWITPLRLRDHFLAHIGADVVEMAMRIAGIHVEQMSRQV